MSALDTYQGMDVMTSLVLAPLVDVTENILLVARGTRSKAWSDFGEYVHEVTRRVSSAIDTGQSGWNEAMANNTTSLNITLNKILRKVHSMSNRSWRYRLLGLVTDGYCIADLRQELDDCLNLFQVSAIASMREDLGEVLSKVRQLYPDSAPNNAGNTGISWYNDQQRSGFGVYDLEPRANSHQVARSIVTSPNVLPSPTVQTPDNGIDSTAFAPTLTKLSLEETIFSALEDVKGYRLLAQEHPEHLISLARSLHHLSDLLTRSGQLEKALSVCQETVDLYRSLAEKRPGPTAQTVGGVMGVPSSAIKGIV